MRCTTCDYPLWRIEGRTCPECGAGFKPSEFRFRVGAVRFRCPGCRTAFYGTSDHGQPEPARFTCPTCGLAVTVDEMILEPTEGVDEDRTGLPPAPWLDRRRIGYVRAWFRTVIRVLGAPGELMRAIPANSPIGEAVLFAATTSLAGVAMVFAIGAVAVPLLFLFVPLPPGTGWLVVVQSLLIGASVVWVILGTLAAGFCAHGLLKLMGGATGGLSRSMQAIFYAHGGTNAINLIPCPCSGFLVPVWWCVATAIMLKTAHRTSAAKATIASILSALVSVAVVMVLSLMPSVLGFGPSRITFNRTALTVVSPSEESVGPLLANPASRPRTPFDLVVDGSLDPRRFRELVRPGEPDAVRIGSLGADAMDTADRGWLRREADRLAAALATGDGPFRLERAVFYYRQATDDPDDWLVLIEPGREKDGRPRGSYRLLTGQGERAVTPERFGKLFDAEQARLAERGRAPLAPPDTVADLQTGALPAPPPSGDGAGPGR